jgi:nucleoside-diphosphate-sugar epimerase
LKILVTGASGFLGKKLLSELKGDAEAEITCVSRTFKKSSDSVTWVEGDLGDQDFIDRLASGKYEKVFHLAWEGLPDRSAEMNLLNLEISKNFLAKLVKNGIQELNIIGSCLEYGDVNKLVSDTELPKGEDSFALAKIELNQYVKNLDVSYRWFRPFFIFGEGQNPNSLIPSLIANLANGLSPEIKAINNSHDFISVNDVAKAIHLASINSSVLGEINVGTGVLTPVGQIVEAFHEKYDLRFNYFFEPNPGLSSNSIKLMNFTNWKPEYVGLKGIIDYYENA